MQSLARNGYTSAQVDAQLHSANLTLIFRFDLLTSSNAFKSTLTNVIEGSVANNALANIKRTARFTLMEDGSINFLSDRIKPYIRLLMPDGGYAEFPQGVFVLSTPPRKTDSNEVITREVEAYDLLQVLVDDKVTDRYTIASGANYISGTNGIKALLDGAGITSQNLTATASTLPAARDWDPGTTKLQIINDLLGAINYRSLYFDENGFATAIAYLSPAARASEYTYIDDGLSVMFPEFEQALDLFGVPNKWTLVVSEPDRTALTSTYTNVNPASSTSTVNRGRTIVSFLSNQEAADQTTLDALAARMAFEDSQVYETVTFETGIMPQHSDFDVYTLTYSTLGISAKYSEVSWEFDLKAGARMKHSVRKVVYV